jgi:PAS domain S-box-containing protein
MLSMNQPIDVPSLEQIIDHTPLTIKPNDSALLAITFMHQPNSTQDTPAVIRLPLTPKHSSQNSYSYVLVLNESKPIGIITEHDVVRLIALGIDLADVKVSEIMTQPVITLCQADNQDVLTALSLLHQHHISHLPIIDEQGLSLGIVAERDLLRLFHPLLATTSYLSPPSERCITAIDIQQHELELEQLRQSQQDLADFVENAIFGLHWVAADGTIIWANQAELDLLGYTREEYIGHSITEFHADQDIIADILQRLLSNQLVQNYEADLRCKDGSIRRVLIDSNSSWRDGEFVRTRCFTRDITDRQCAEEALRRSEQKFHAIFDGMFQFMGVLTPEGIIIEANRTALDAVAVNLEDVVGKMFWETQWWTHSLLLQEQLKKAITRAAKGELVRFEAEHILADGLSVFVDFTIKPIFDEVGKVIMLIPEGRDITDRKQTETQLRQQEEFLKSIYDGTEQAVFVVDVNADRELHYASFNPVSERYAGVTNEQIQGKTPEAAFGEALGSKLRQNYERSLQASASVTYEEQLNFATHSIWALTTLVPLWNEQDQIYRIIGTATDITDRKQAELELQNQKQDLARSNAELQQFAYVASHDLQEPLRMITSYLELLERRYKGQLDERADKFIAYAVDGATRMQTLINDLLSYSRVGTSAQDWKTVDCEKVVQNVLSNLHLSILQNNAVITHDSLPKVNADPSQMTQLFQNLISNAIKFHRKEEAPQIHIGVECTDGKWLFSVQDNGIGMEVQYLARIFIIFQRLHSKTDYPGTGIGLAVCKKIVERHGGNLRVESQPNRGSTFYFTIPQIAGKS